MHKFTENQMKLTTTLLTILLAVSCSRAAEPNSVLKLWPDTPPGPAREVGEEQDITKDSDRLIAGRRIIKLANVATPEAHVYLPPKEQRTGAAVVICPGGGYHILAWDLEGTEVAEWLNSNGVTAIVLKYRVPTARVEPKWLQPVQDAQRTISLVRAHADEWGVDVDRVGILGFSAGGHTAAKTAYAAKRHYQPTDDADQQSYRPNAAVLIYPAYLHNEDKTALAEDLHVKEDSPPAFIVHAFDDRVPAEGSLFLTLALKQAGVASELHLFDTGGHGYGLRNVPEHPVTRWPTACEEWLNRNGWLDSPTSAKK